jgi:predicted nucleic acid-binding protein
LALGFSVVLDANVLYPAYLRDALLRLAYAGVYQVCWTDQILYEMARNLKKKVPESRHDRVDRLAAKMNEAFPEARVTGYEGLIPSMTNHPKDRHVLAAAVAAGADLLVTRNVKDFPPGACEPHDIDVQPPDDFLCYQWELRSPEYLTMILEGWASSLSNPPYTLEALLEERLAKSAPKFSETVLQFVRSRT